MKKTNDNIVIRRATVQDASSLFELINALAEYEQLPGPNEEALERLKNDTLSEFPRVSTWIAEYENKAVGYAMVLFTYSSFLAKPTLFIEDLFVLPIYRGKGIGSALYRNCAQLALEEGCGRMEWLVLDWNRPAMDFYENNGATKLYEWIPYRMTRENLIDYLNTGGTKNGNENSGN